MTAQDAIKLALFISELSPNEAFIGHGQDMMELLPKLARALDEALITIYKLKSSIEVEHGTQSTESAYAIWRLKEINQIFEEEKA